MRFTLLLATLGIFVGCRGRPETRTPPNDGLALGPSIEIGALEVWPVFADDVADVEPLLTLEQAQEQGRVEIRELSDARVGTILIDNRGDARILACAGTIVAGGKQDRQLGEDIVVDPGTTVSVKAFCVERARWSGGDNFAASSVMASAPVRAAGQYAGDQRRVWYDIEVTKTPSSAPGGSHRSIAETAERRTGAANVIVQHLRAQAGNLVGFAYAIDGCAAGMRTFASRALLEPRLEGFVRAVCFEYEHDEYVADREGIRARFNDEWRTLLAQIENHALPHAEVVPEPPEPREPIDVPTLVRELNAMPEEVATTQGANRNGYRRAKAGNHSACYVQTKDGRWVPITRDWTAR